MTGILNMMKILNSEAVMIKVYIDFETRSVLDLKKVGLMNYARNAEVLVLSYKSDNGAVKTVPFLNCVPDICELNRFAENPNVLFIAHNAAFERMIWRWVLSPQFGLPDIPVTRWRCTMAKALVCGLPESLNGATVAIGCAAKKDIAGRAVMLRMCFPKGFTDCVPVWNEDPKEFERLCAYNAQDVEAEAELDSRLPDLSPYEQKIWYIDQLQNETGVLTDKSFAYRASTLKEEAERTFNEYLRHITRGEIDAFTQHGRILSYLRKRGYPYDSLGKFWVKKAVDEGVLDKHCLDVLRLRQRLGKSSTAKYDQFCRQTDETGRLFFYQTYHGASTGRWTSKGVQLLNLPRGVKGFDCDAAIQTMMAEDYKITEQTLSDLSNCVRATIIAEEGKMLFLADFSAIEARALMWAAKEENGMKAFVESDAGRSEDIYVLMARKIYRDPTINKKREEREIGKRAVLGLGYGMGAKRFLETCELFGQIISLELAETAKKTYRETFTGVVRFWDDQINAAITAVKNPGVTVYASPVSWVYEPSFLRVTLPSGRVLRYLSPRIQKNEYGEELSFSGVSKNGGLVDEKLYGGKLTENIIQAISRDIMVEAMLRVWKAGYAVLFNVYDELVATAAENAPIEPMIELMSESPKWAPGLVLKAEGKKTKRYGK